MWLGVAGERVDPLAARVAERGRGAGLALGALGHPAFADDHLQRDVEAVSLVAGEPDVPHPSRAERPERAVPSEDQLGARRRRRPRSLLLRAEENSFRRRTRVRFGTGMDPPDDDIQFDFFEEEPVTAEAAPRARGRADAPRRAGGRRGSAPRRIR